MKTSHYDVADHLRTSDEMEIYLEACIEVAEGDSAFIEKARMDIARAQDKQLILTRRESMRLLELIENPPPRNDKFLQAMNRYQASIDEPRLPAQEFKDDGPLTNEDISNLRKVAEPMLPKGKIISTRSLL